MSTGDPNDQAASSETTAEVVAPAKPAVVKKPKKAAAKPVAKAAKPVVNKQAKKAVKKTTAKKPAAKKPTAKKASAKKTSQRGKGPANLRNQLHTMLLKKLPEKYRFDKQSLDFVKIAAAHKMTVEGVYKWFRVDRITPIGAMGFVSMGGGKVKLTDFHPFVFKK
jgi:DnaK suppressor protein